MGKELGKIFTSKEEALDVIEKAILLFKEQGEKGERFAETIDRIGFEKAEKQLLSDELLPHAAMLKVIAATRLTARTFFNFIIKILLFYSSFCSLI